MHSSVTENNNLSAALIFVYAKEMNNQHEFVKTEMNRHLNNLPVRTNILRGVSRDENRFIGSGIKINGFGPYLAMFTEERLFKRCSIQLAK